MAVHAYHAIAWKVSPPGKVRGRTWSHYGIVEAVIDRCNLTIVALPVDVRYWTHTAFSSKKKPGVMLHPRQPNDNVDINQNHLNSETRPHSLGLKLPFFLEGFVFFSSY